MPDPAPSTAPLPESELLQQHLDAVTRMRQGGASYDEIHQYYEAQTARMRAGDPAHGIAGASEAEVAAYFGGTDPAPVVAGMQAHATQTVRVQGASTSLVDAFTQGYTNSSTAALLGQKPAGPVGTDFASRLVGQVGETVGDLPAMWLGGSVGGAIGPAPGLVVGATVGGGPEDVPADIGGAALGKIAASGAGTLALPEFIKSERQAYIEAQNRGWSVEHFLQAQGQVLQNTAGQAALGAATAGVGGVVDRVLAKAAIPTLAKGAAKVTAETGAYVTAASAMKGKLPTIEDLVDATVILAAFHVAGSASGATMRTIRGRLQQNYVETGQDPMAAAQQAKTDPVKRAELMGNPAPPTRPGSSRIEFEHDNGGVVGQPTEEAGSERPGYSGAFGPNPPPYRGAFGGRGAQPPTRSGILPSAGMPGAPPPEQYVAPRVHGDFDTSVAFTLKHEGGAEVIDANGAPVKWGINKADNPGVDVDHLSAADAAEIYKRKYWDAIGADQLPPAMRQAAFDTAVVEGVGRAKQWLAESGGDPKVLLGKRAAFEAELAAKNPAKYGRFVKAWGNRIRDLGGHDASVGLVGRDPTDPLTPAEEALIGNGGLPPEKPPEEGGGGSGEPPSEPGDAEAGDRIAARTAPPAEDNWWGDTVQSASRIYGEMFNPDHPIRSMMEGLTQGKDITAVTEPEALRRLAENASVQSKYAIEHGMIDLDNNVTGRGLKPIIEDAGNKTDQRAFLDRYARARWADSMHDRGLTTGIDPLDAKQVIRDMEAQHPKWSALFEEMQDWRNGTLKWLGDGGVHSKSKIDAMIANGEAAMPGYRRMEDGTLKPNPSPGKGMYSPIRAAKGSERLIEPIEQSLMRDALLRRSLAETNRSNAAIADAAIDGNKASERRSVSVNVMTAIDELRAKGLDDEDLPTALLKAAGREVKDNEVPVFRDGKLSAVTFENPEITRVLRGFDSGVRSSSVKLAAAITAIPRTLQTIANPLFAPKMQVYDAWFQHITNPDSRNVMKSFTMGLGAMLDHNSGMYDEWMRSGGAERVFTRMSTDTYLKDTFGLRGPEQPGLMDNAWNAAKGVGRGFDAWARMASTPIRLGRYVQGRAAGESMQRAAVASTESSLHRPNFGGPLSKVLNSVMPFLTARLNGMEKTARAMMGGSLETLSDGRLSNKTQTGIPYSAKQFWINGAIAITVPALMTWWANKDEPWYKAMPDWQKDNSIAIIPPTGVTAPIPIPAPPLLGPIFSGIPRRLMEAFAEDNPHAFDNLGPSLFAGLAGPAEFVSASVLQPFVEHLTNYSFLKNAPLVNPDTVKGVGAAEQFTHYSSAPARAIARFTNDLPLISGMKLSPQVIDNYIRYWGGQPGQVAIQAADAGVNAGKANKPPAETFVDWPGVSSWMVRYPSASAQPITDFYDRSNQFDQVHGSLKALMEDGDLARFKEIAERSPAAAAYHLLRFQNEPADVDVGPYMQVLQDASAKADWPDLSLYKEGQEAVKQASVYANKVWENPALTPLDKRQILDQTYAELQVISERTNEALDRAENGRARGGAQAPEEGINFTPPDQRVQ